ncbi:MAG: ATP-binding protein [Gammaproteobacteria bacterium]|nr:ATP-binding protein [Gammaproteobacteria bacterium]
MNLRVRLVMLAVLPVLLVTLILGFYIASSRIDDVRNELDARGKILVKSLLPVAEYGLFTGNENILRNACEATLREDDVLSVAVTDAKGEFVWHSYRDNFIGRPAESDGKLLYFRQEIYRTGMQVSDFAEEHHSSGDAPALTMGWVEVVLSKEASIERQQNEWLNALAIMLVGLFASLMLGLRMGQGVAMPLMALTRSVKRMERGESDIRVKEDASGELLSLQTGFNSMVDSLQKAHSELQNRVQEATRELQQTLQDMEGKNIELENARRQAMLASMAKTDFLAKMSHEIRTPVNAILGFTRLLKKNLREKDQNAEYAQTATRAAEQLLFIINDILDFSKLEFGDVKLENIDFDIRDSLEDAISMCCPLVHEKGLELVLLIDSDVPVKVTGDPMRLNQIFSNLLNNAVKFTSKGGVTAQLSLMENGTDYVSVRVEVRDTGIGLNPVEQRGLFKAFSQADNTITRRFGGTGLGLSIARRFVELMDGSIGVTSEPGMGATFWFEVRLGKQKNVLPDDVSPIFAGRNAVVYDAHPVARRSLRNTLVGWQMRVLNTGDVTKLEHMLVNSVDLLLLGLNSEEAQSRSLQSMISRVREVYAGPILLLPNVEEFSLPAPLNSDNHLMVVSKPARRMSIYRCVSQLLNGEGEVNYADGVAEVGHDLPMENFRVLVADDNDFNLMLVSTLLKQRSVQVIEARNGAEAVQKFGTEDVDVVLLDVHMPGVDGIEACRQMRQNFPQKRVPIIALTADVFADHEQRLLRAGADDILFKPITEQQLWKTLGKWLALDRLKAGSAEQTFVMAQQVNVPASLLPQLKQELPLHISQAIEACEREDMAAVHSSVHKLNGLAGYFRLQSLHAEIKSLELDLLQMKYDNLSARLSAAKENIAVLLTEMSAENS